MSDSSFATRMRSIVAEAPAERHRQMVEWHRSLMRRYGDRLGDFTDEDAERISTDGRTLALVIGHITGWETWLIQAAGEVLSGCRWPEIMELRGYLEGDDERRSFETIDEFNAAQARLQSDWPWRRIREQALRTSATLYALYTTPGLLTPDRMEATREYAWSLQPGTRTPIPVGWFLWGVVLEHMAFDHAVDLGLST